MKVLTNDCVMHGFNLVIGHFLHWSFLTFIPQGCDIYLSGAPKTISKRVEFPGSRLLLGPEAESLRPAS